METMPAKFKFLGLAMIAGSALWVATECMEIVGGTASSLSMTITGFAFIGLTIGIWGVHAGQAAKGGTVSLIGTACLSMAYFIFMGGSFSVLSSVITYESLAATNWIFAGFIFMVSGAPLLGLAVIRARVFPPWVGGILVLAPLVTSTTMIAGLPPILMNIANISVGIGIITMARQLLSGQVETVAA